MAQMTVSKTIGIGFVSLIILSVVSGTVSLLSFKKLDASRAEAARRKADILTVLNIPYLASQHYMFQTNYINSGEQKYLDSFVKVQEEFDKTVLQAKTIVDTPEEISLLDEVISIDRDYDSVFHNIIVPELKKADKADRSVIADADKRTTELLSGVDSRTSRIIESLNEEISEATQQYQQVASFVQAFIIGMGIAIIIIGSVVAVSIIRSISKLLPAISR